MISLNNIAFNTYNNKNISFQSIRINSKNNKHYPYLYNDVLDIVKQNKISSLFTNDTIILETEDMSLSTRKSLIQRLKDLKIKYTHDDK